MTGLPHLIPQTGTNPASQVLWQETFLMNLGRSSLKRPPSNRTLEWGERSSLLLPQTGTNPTSNVRWQETCWLPRNPLEQPLVAHCRETREIHSKLMRKRLLAAYFELYHYHVWTVGNDGIGIVDFSSPPCRCPDHL